MVHFVCIVYVLLLTRSMNCTLQLDKPIIFNALHAIEMASFVFYYDFENYLEPTIDYEQKWRKKS